MVADLGIRAAQLAKAKPEPAKAAYVARVAARTAATGGPDVASVTRTPPRPAPSPRSPALPRGPRRRLGRGPRLASVPAPPRPAPSLGHPHFPAARAVASRQTRLCAPVISPTVRAPPARARRRRDPGRRGPRSGRVAGPVTRRVTGPRPGCSACSAGPAGERGADLVLALRVVAGGLVGRLGEEGGRLLHVAAGLVELGVQVLRLVGGDADPAGADDALRPRSSGRRGGPRCCPRRWRCGWRRPAGSPP